MKRNTPVCGYIPLPMEKRRMCPSCGKYHMQMWSLPFDRVWHCAGCGNTLIANHAVSDWSKLVGTTIKCKFGARNCPAGANDTVLNADVLSVRGNEVEIRTEHGKANWYTIYDGYVGSGNYYSGWHIEKVR